MILAMDIGGTNTALGLLDEGPALRSEHSLPTCPDDGPARLLERCLDWAAEQGSPRPAILSVGAPNADARSGWILCPPNLPWGDVDLAGLIRARCPRAIVAIHNDASAAAWGEATHGAGRGLTDFVQLTLGTGLGAGLICDGRLLLGARGFAGEVGHLLVHPGGRPCGCGRKGCLERYVSAGGLHQTALELGIPEPFSARSLEQAALEGHAPSAEAYRLTGQTLGLALAELAALLDPSAFVISGGLAAAGELLLGPARITMEERILPVLQGRIELRTSALVGAHAALLGLAELGLQAARAAR
jgi:glucokinase